jgi:hypothetical protein
VELGDHELVNASAKFYVLLNRAPKLFEHH